MFFVEVNVSLCVCLFSCVQVSFLGVSGDLHAEFHRCLQERRSTTLQSMLGNEHHTQFTCLLVYTHTHTHLRCWAISATYLGQHTWGNILGAAALFFWIKAELSKAALFFFFKGKEHFYFIVLDCFLKQKSFQRLQIRARLTLTWTGMLEWSWSPSRDEFWNNTVYTEHEAEGTHLQLLDMAGVCRHLRRLLLLCKVATVQNFTKLPAHWHTNKDLFTSVCLCEME